ncbi:TPA_asm: hypothetical protein GYQ38_06655 [Listeria monocytogenes]|uniref:hypothetical protein n=1 Tax=Listeria monocytogenes TaxID=1639 RepID=UPI0013AB2B15|nr:hypothetical protein [Listeria monocytogenes]EDN8082982.1 hypothetical protein [Listeria monocytogenes]EJQ3168201.1 hypothetical protein [Listeria monocytogenes]HAB8021245.1 hypothetical protein [Listeria monocytogenes]HAB8778346.1 hypothetical protein [Listeria monocytogenes]
MPAKDSYDEGYQAGIADAVSCVELARNSGEADLRQLRYWIKDAANTLKEAAEEDF